jgi:hypothetical protein
MEMKDDDQLPCIFQPVLQLNCFLINMTQNDKMIRAFADLAAPINWSTKQQTICHVSACKMVIFILFLAGHLLDKMRFNNISSEKCYLSREMYSGLNKSISSRC